MRVTGGRLKNHVLKAPPTSKTRPTTEKLRQTLFDICQHRIVGATFLDLFAGSGAIGIEALSRGAEKVTFIEQDRTAVQTLKSNLFHLQLSSFSQLIVGDLFKRLKQLSPRSFDIIYLDPPYGLGLSAKALILIDELGLLKESGLLFLEEKDLISPKLSSLALIRVRRVGDSSLFEFAHQSMAL